MDKLHLVELIGEGLSQQKIADRCNVNVSTVKRNLKKYGLKTQNPRNPRYDSIEKSLLEELIAKGLTQGKIAERCNRSQGSVTHWLEKYGLKTQHTTKRFTVDYGCACGETDPSKFYKTRKAKCRTCQIIENQHRSRVYKEQAVRRLGGKCVVCGYDKCVAALQFHHKDPSEKDPDFRKSRNWSYERKRAELEKCELLCANCHAELHFKPLKLNGRAP